MASVTPTSTNPKRSLDEDDHTDSDAKRTAPRSFDDLSLECAQMAATTPRHLSDFAESLSDRPYDVALMEPLAQGECSWAKLLQTHKAANAFVCKVTTTSGAVVGPISCMVLIVTPSDQPEPAIGELCGSHAYAGAFGEGAGAIDLGADRGTRFHAMFLGDGQTQYAVHDSTNKDCELWVRGPHHHRVLLSIGFLEALRSAKAHPYLAASLEYLRTRVSNVENDRVLYALTGELPLPRSPVRTPPKPVGTVSLSSPPNKVPPPSSPKRAGKLSPRNLTAEPAFRAPTVAPSDAVSFEKRKALVAQRSLTDRYYTFLFHQARDDGETVVIMPPSAPQQGSVLSNRQPAQLCAEPQRANAFFGNVHCPELRTGEITGYANSFLIVCDTDDEPAEDTKIGQRAYLGPLRERSRIDAVHWHVARKTAMRKTYHRSANYEIGDRDFFTNSRWHTRVRLPQDMLAALRKGERVPEVDQVLEYLNRVIGGCDGDRAIYDVCTDVANLAPPTPALPPPPADGRTLCREIISVRNGGYFDRLYVPSDLLTPEEHQVLDDKKHCSWDSGESWADYGDDVEAWLGFRLGFSALPKSARKLPAEEQEAMRTRESELAKLAITDLSKVRVDRPSACAIDWC